MALQFSTGSSTSNPLGSPAVGANTMTTTPATNTQGGYGSATAFANWFNPSPFPSSLPVTPTGNITNPAAPAVTQPQTPSTPGAVTSPTAGLQDQIDTLKNTTASDTGTTYNQTNGFTTGATGANAPFNVDTSSMTSSNLSGGPTYNDVLARRQQMENTYLDAYNKSTLAQGALAQAKVQDMGLVNNAQYSGDTVSFGQGAASVAQNAANIREANLGVQAQIPLLQAQGISNALGFMNQDIQNQLATVPNLQNVTQAADGSIVGFIRNPLTGAVTSKNFGNPLTGTFSSDGESGASIGGGSSTQNQNGAGSISLPSNGDGTYQTANGGSVNAVYAQKISQLSPQYQNYALSGPQGVAYIDSSRLSALPQGVQYQIQQQAATAGIPWLDQSQASGMQQVQDLYTTLSATQQLVNTELKSGPSGAITDYARTRINDIFQNEPALQAFNALRTQAGTADTSLMGGIGSGFRQNTANLELSVQNFPRSSDSIETASAKIANIKYLLDTSLQKTFPGLQTGSSLVNNGQAGSTGGTYVQTKIGAVPTNW